MTDSHSQPSTKPVRLSDRERKALAALADAGGSMEYGYLSFKGIASRSGLDLLHVRRTVRALARKGLAEYGKGLWTDDGELAGAGYCATEAGIDAALPLSSGVARAPTNPQENSNG